MKKVIMIGGNGYIGRETLKYWLEKEPKTEFFIISRSGKNSLENKRVHSILANAWDFDDMMAKIPHDADYIVNFAGGISSNKQETINKNKKPVENMLKIAEKINVKAIGFVAGQLWPKEFTKTKAEMLKKLQNSKIPLEYVNPTLVYGAGRNDFFTKLLPILHFLGIFSQKFRPVKVETVAKELVEKIILH